MDAVPRQIYRLVLKSGERPFDVWLDSIRDDRSRARISRQIEKLAQGNFGDHKDFDGIGELRLDFGPGYRVYFARHGSIIVVLLGGGNKSGQSRDIANARQRWIEWKKSARPMEEILAWAQTTIQEEEE